MDKLLAVLTDVTLNGDIENHKEWNCPAEADGRVIILVSLKRQASQLLMLKSFLKRKLSQLGSVLQFGFE